MARLDQHRVAFRIVDAIDMVITPHAPTPISGDLGTDLQLALTSLRARLERRPVRIWFATLLDHANRDATFAAAQLRFVAGILQPVGDVIRSGQDRGELPDELDVVRAALQLAAPILTPHVFLRSTVTDTEIGSAITHFLADTARLGGRTG